MNKRRFPPSPSFSLPFNVGYVLGITSLAAYGIVLVALGYPLISDLNLLIMPAMVLIGTLLGLRQPLPAWIPLSAGLWMLGYVALFLIANYLAFASNRAAAMEMASFLAAKQALGPNVARGFHDIARSSWPILADGGRTLFLILTIGFEVACILVGLLIFLSGQYRMHPLARGLGTAYFLVVMQIPLQVSLRSLFAQTMALGTSTVTVASGTTNVPGLFERSLDIAILSLLVSIPLAMMVDRKPLLR